MPVNDLIILRKGLGSEWTTSNPILASGEPGYDITNNILKVGDGVSTWNNLDGIGGGEVSNETIDDRVASLLVAGSGISLNYNDNENSLNISFSGIDLGSYPLITISSQPVNISGYFDETLSFEVVATSTFPVRTLYYQWQKSANNISFNNISGQNNSTLTFNTSSNEDNGYYRCLLTSDLSVKYSNSALLSVSMRPSPTPTPTVTPTVTPSITPTLTPTITPTPSITPTNTITPTPTVTPSVAIIENLESYMYSKEKIYSWI